MNEPYLARLAVCSWSLQPADPKDLADKLRATGIHRTQLALDPLRENPALWGHAADTLRQNDISIISGMFGTIGEDYTTLETIRRTGGIAPDNTWEQNLANIQVTAELAQKLGLRLVTFHAGFMPHNPAEPNFAKMLARLAKVADIFGARKLTLGLETGQETAPVLVSLLERLGRENVGVNFDPANMILYDKGNPIQALRELGSWIRQVHIKDATRTGSPGTWGEEVPADEGEVDWRSFFPTLKELNFTGDFVIEREAGDRRVTDIQTARLVVQRNLQT
jgi:L-ribulose-5-phosphate 3-epimerase